MAKVRSIILEVVKEEKLRFSLRRNIRKIFEETGLDKKFNKVMTQYKGLDDKVVTVEREMDKAKKDFVSKYKNADTSSEKNKIKSDHIKNMKKLEDELKKATQALRDATIEFDTAVINLPDVDETELD